MRFEGPKVAFLVTDNFEQVELSSPRAALDEHGIASMLIAEHRGTVRGMHHDRPGDAFDVDVAVDEADSDLYDALVLPGGVFNADAIRTNEAAQQFVRRIDAAGKPVFVICHGAWLLVSAGLVRGRRLTSWPSLRDDIVNAGGHWVDEPLVQDDNLYSSRRPDDLPQFNERLLEVLARQRDRVAVGSPDSA